MVCSSLRFGETTIAKAKTSSDFKALLTDPLLNSDPIIVKPNWVTGEAGAFTTADTLKKLFETLSGKIIVVESYQFGRSWESIPCGFKFTANGEEHDWSWFKGKGWSWLQSHPDWGWFRDSLNWDELRKADSLFLEKHGFSDLFKEFGAEYLNVTEEVWSGRVADSTLVKEAVETQYSPCFTEKLYHIVPECLLRYRGATLISLTRLKEYNSFTLKNLLGLIPDPIRSWWHGPKDVRLSQSIVDTAKVYGSLFRLCGVWEYAGSTRLRNSQGKLGDLPYRFDMVEGPGILVFGRNLVEMDTLLHSLSGYVESGAEHIILARGVLGKYDTRLIYEAKKKIGDWFKPNY